MFLVSDSLENRARSIRGFLQKQPSIALIVAAVYFEWTVCRALIALSNRSNADVRHSIAPAAGLEKYKEVWWTELGNQRGALRLPELVNNWDAVKRAFDERNRLVHGRKRHTRNMATPHVEALLAAVAEVDEYCRSRGRGLGKRLPVRKKARTVGAANG